MLSEEYSRHVGRFYGKYRGKVADTDDKDFRGTIQVLVPSVFGPDVTVAAAPCLPYGHFFVPPKDTDIWVEFEAGDTASPLWVGVWYPKGKSPEEAQVTPPEHQVIRTAAGHVVEIVDTEGEEQILIRHSGGASFSIDHEGTLTLKADKVIVDSGSVALGSGASEPTLLGNAFKELWTTLLTHQHPTAAPGSPSPMDAVTAKSLKLLPSHLTSEVTVK